MTHLAFLVALGLHQVSLPAPAQQSLCTQALAAGTGGAGSEICLGEEQLRQGTAARDLIDRHRLFEAAAVHFQRALSQARDDKTRIVAGEALVLVYDAKRLNEPDRVEAALRELIDLQPLDLSLVFRLARAQEDRGSLEAAEETLLTARRQQPSAVEPYRMLSQFYARRVTAMHKPDASVRPPTAAGQPDENGIYRIGDSLTAPARLDRPVFPPEALAAGVDGVVIAEVVISPAGDVVDAKIVRSIPMLDDAALRAVRNWHFAPTVVNDQPVPVRMTVTVNFTTK
jgi:TonB family protein